MATKTGPVRTAPLLTEDIATAKLDEAKAALGRGDKAAAYQLCAEATRLAPRSVDAWILRARTANAIEETLACLSRALAVDPNHPVARWGLYASMNRLLQKDGFLAYVAETDAFYNIQTGNGLPLTVPKERATAEPYPPPRPQPLRRAYRWLALAVLTLPLAGLPTLLFAPLAGMEALRVAGQSRDLGERVRGRVVLALAVALALVALALSRIFELHL